MRFTRQVLHVARKDLMHLRWLFVLYAALVALKAVVHFPMTLAQPVRSSDLLVGILSIPDLVAALLVALIVQADAPASPSADWVTRPLRPAAILSSKVLLCLTLLVLVSVVSVIPALVSLQTPMSAAIRTMGSLFLLGSALVLVGVVIAAITVDLKSFILTIVVLGVAASVLLRDTNSGGNAWITAFCGLIILLHAYRSRHVVRLRALVAGCAALVILAPPLPRLIKSDVYIAPGYESLIATPSISVQRLQLQRIEDERTLSVSVNTAAFSSKYRYDLKLHDVVVERANGEMVRVRRLPDEDILLHYPELDVGPTVEWIGRRHPPIMNHGTSVSLGRSRNRTSSAEYRSAMLSGEVQVLEAREIGRLPLRTGATFVNRGVRIRITDARQRSVADDAWLRVRYSATSGLPNSVSGNGAPSPGRGWQGLAFVLVSSDGTRAVALEGGAGNSQPLPSAVIGAGSIELNPAGATFMPQTAPHVGTLEGFELVVYDWHPVARVPFSIKQPITAR